MERMGQYFGANGIVDDEKMRAVFLTVVGRETSAYCVICWPPKSLLQKLTMS